MAASTVHLFGRLGSEPELKYLSSEEATAVCSFSLAVDKGAKGTRPDWWKVTAWRGLAEFLANHATKGGRVVVTGIPTLNEWTGKDGVEHATLAVTAQSVQLIDWVSDGTEAGEEEEDPFREEPAAREETAAPTAKPVQTAARRQTKQQTYNAMAQKHGNRG